MKQIIVSNLYPEWPMVEIDYHRPIKFYLNGWLNFDPNPNNYNILHIREPEEVCGLRNHVINNQHLFNLILTSDSEILKNCKNAVVLEPALCWVYDYDFPEKNFSISHLTGYKNWTEGHRLRQKVYFKQNKITIPKNFFVSKEGNFDNPYNNPILGEKKNPLFDSQFHICIENTKQEFFFSEKIIDCFLTKTIPIFWGTPRIGEYFNTNGMYLVENINDILNVCNSLTPEDYSKKLEFIEENFKKSQNYLDLPKRIKEKIEQNL